MLAGVGCDHADVKALKGVDRLKRGCPTHSAFHFYSTGCPTDPEAAAAGFVQHLNDAKGLNEKYGLQGTIVNELGSLMGSDAGHAEPNEACTDDQIAAMIGTLAQRGTQRHTEAHRGTQKHTEAHRGRQEA